MSTNFAHVEPIVESSVVFDNDVNLERFGWMAGPDIDLQHRSGSQYVGGFRDDLIPARSLLRLPRSVAFGPYEHPATVLYGEEQGSAGALIGIAPAASSTPDKTLNALKGTASRLSSFQRPPKWCAYTLMRENEKRGMCLFENVKGFDWEEVKKIYSLIIPPNVQVWREDFNWTMERTVIGQTVKGPFLDEVRAYLKVGGLAGERIKEAAAPGRRTAPAEHLRAATDMIKVMRLACDRAWSYFTVRLNESESAIRRYRDGKPGLQDYAQVDERFVSSRLPMDVLALANLNRTPIDLQQLGAAQAMTRDSNQAMMKGFEMIADKFVAKNTPSLTQEEIFDMFDKKLTERDEFWKSEIVKLSAPKTEGDA